MNWRSLPMPRLLLPLVLGIWAGDCLEVPSTAFQHWSSAFLFLPGFLFLLAGFSPGFRGRSWFGVLVFITLFSLGGFRIEQSQHWDSPKHFSWQAQGDSIGLWGKVLEIRPGPNTYRVVLQVGAKTKIGQKNWHSTTGKLLAYLKYDPNRGHPQNGQYLYLSGVLSPPNPGLNPDAFDFQAYLARQGIYHQMYAGLGSWKIDETRRSVSLPLSLQAFCLQTLKKHLFEANTYAVGSALILGERNQLSSEIKQAYSNSGAVHVLSVSGLHVGIFALVLRFIFGCFGSNKKIKKLSLVLELFSIWVFTLLTGAAPATLRAAVMFSMIIGARALTRQFNIWNILAGSAFFLLCWQPNLLWMIGFQLSYLAIVGIVAFQPWIYQCWTAPNAFLDYLWKLSSVGFAAQLSTGPLSIYYFHQFPLFFWLSGLIAVPLSGLILVLGLCLFLLEATGLPAAWIGQLLAWTIQLLNAAVVFIQELPQAIISGFWWNTWLTLGVYAVLALLGIAFYRKQLWWFNLALLLLLTLALGRWPGIYRAQLQKRLVCYQVPKASVIDIMVGQELISLSNAGEGPALMATQNHRIHSRIRKQDQKTWENQFSWGPLTYQSGRLDWEKVSIGLLDGSEKSTVSTSHYLLIRNNPRVYSSQLPKGLKLIILDGSNHKGTRRWVKKLAAEKRIPVHDTAEQGAWIINF